MTVKKNFFTAGMEIECILNGKIHKFGQGGYHNGIQLPGSKYWDVESDSSVGIDGSEDWESSSRIEITMRSMEFVSKKVKNKEQWDEMINEFKTIISVNGKYELSKVIHFPTSTGNHIHFSIKGFKFSSKFPFSLYGKVRDFFLNKVKESKIESKKMIVEHYFRGHYAKKIQREGMYERDRYYEFNLDSEYTGRGLEWRSPCIHHLKTWKEFDEIMNILWDSINYLYNLTLKYEFKSYSIIPKIKSLDKTDTNYEQKITTSENFESVIKLKESINRTQADKFFGYTTTIEEISE